MNPSDIRWAFLNDERLSTLAVSALPAWLWSTDASRILWANPTGAAVFGAAGPAVIATRKFDAGQPAAAQIAQLATKLAENATPQVERLRGFGAGVGRALPCACSRITLADGTPAILVVASERAGPDLSPHERVVRLFSGCEAALAVFSSEGKLIHATLSADDKLRGARSLAALGVGAAASDALVHGQAQSTTAYGPIAIKRIGADPTTVLVVDFSGAQDDTSPLLGSSDNAVTTQPPVQSIVAPAAASGAADAQVTPTAVTAPNAQVNPTELAGSSERRHPLRFVWQMDDDNRFSLDSEEFIALIGPRTADVIGRPWHDAASKLDLDPDGRVAQAIATRNTWSGINVAWPVDGSRERLTVEMSGLPVFDRERAFRGYRGFGVCRDLARLSNLARLRGMGAPATAAAPAGAQVAATAQASSAAKPSAAATILPAPSPAPATPAPAPNTPALSPLEHHAFHELSRRLAQHLDAGKDASGELDYDISHFDDADAFVASAHDVRTMFERLPMGVLIYRLDQLIYANPAFLQAVGHRSLDELAGAGGLDSLLVTPANGSVDQASGEPLALTIERGDRGRLEAELIRIDWEGEMAHALVTKAAVGERTVPRGDSVPLNAEIAELQSILDTATDGVVMLDRAGNLLSATRGAETLFGYDTKELSGSNLFDLLAPESHDVAQAYLDSLRDDAAATMPNSEREIIGRGREGGLIPLFMTLGAVGESKDKLCAVFRDLRQWKKTEDELIATKRQAEKASSAKSEFLAKVSHEIRTPLNAIIGFSEVMMDERFGSIENERYRGYLRDIHVSGGHLLSLINDLLDLSKIEAGKLELSFANVSLNDLTQQCVAIMQPQANRERVIIRTALAPKLPQVVADARSVRQIVLNLLTNSIKFTSAGGQVIISTALKDDGEVALRVRDTGIGMSEKDLATALEPFRQVATTGRPGGTGLGLPLTKALAEANQASFAIQSAPKEGTLVEVAFPPSQVLVG